MEKLAHFCNAIVDKRDGIAVEKLLRGVYNRMSTQIFVSMALAIGTAKAKVAAAAATYGFINGVPFTKAITDDCWTLSGTVTADAFNVYCLYLNSAGTASSQMGAEGASLAAVKFPPLPEDKVMVGFVVVNPTGTGNFVGGTTELDDATVVPNAVYVNTIGMFDWNAIL